MMPDKVLLIRMADIGEVAAIGVPALRHMQRCLPDADLHMLTYGAGAELIRRVSEDIPLIILPEGQWSDNLFEAMDAFLALAEIVVAEQYTQIINLDTGFMPCFLARFLKDAGETVSGNVINLSVQDFIAGIEQQTLSPEFVSSAQHYMESSFQGMRRWHTRWWEIAANAWSYPEFYLRQCCGFSPLEYLPLVHIEADTQVLSIAQDKPVVMVAIDAFDNAWPNPNHLTRVLTERGIHAEQIAQQSKLDQQLARIKAANLLVTTPGADQWLAQAAGVPVLVICGNIDARLIKPDYAVGEHGKLPSVQELARNIEEIVKHHAKL